MKIKSTRSEILALQKGIKSNGNPFGVTLLHFLQLDWPDSNFIITHAGQFMASSGLEIKEARQLTRLIIENALKTYGETLFSADRRQKNEDPYRIAVFVNSVIYQTIKLLEQGVGEGSKKTAKVTDDGANVTWGQSQTITDSEKLALRAYLYDLFVKEELKQALRRSEYEQTLLDDAFNIGDSGARSNASCAW